MFVRMVRYCSDTGDFGFTFVIKRRGLRLYFSFLRLRANVFTPAGRFSHRLHDFIFFHKVGNIHDDADNRELERIFDVLLCLNVLSRNSSRKARPTQALNR